MGVGKYWPTIQLLRLRPLSCEELLSKQHWKGQTPANTTAQMIFTPGATNIRAPIIGLVWVSIDQSILLLGCWMATLVATDSGAPRKWTQLYGLKLLSRIHCMHFEKLVWNSWVTAWLNSRLCVKGSMALQGEVCASKASLRLHFRPRRELINERSLGYSWQVSARPVIW